MVFQHDKLQVKLWFENLQEIIMLKMLSTLRNQRSNNQVADLIFILCEVV